MQLHAVIDGPDDAPTLVLGGSLGSTLEMWDLQIPVLAGPLRVVRYDHRGHGGSPTVPGPYTLDDLGGDVVALLDDLGLGRVHIGGLSLGGMVSMWLAVNAPERVDRMAVLCTSARLGPASMWEERAAIVRAQGTAAIAPMIVGRWFTPALAATRPDLIAEYEGMLEGIDAEGYASCCAAIAAMDLLDDLASVRAPTLVIAGADDPATPPEHGEAITDRIPAAHLEVVAGAAHFANVEQPDEVSALLLAHFCGAGEPA
jgi:3-oxoadipate enol-lactonase